MTDLLLPGVLRGAGRCWITYAAASTGGDRWPCGACCCCCWLLQFTLLQFTLKDKQQLLPVSPSSFTLKKQALLLQQLGASWVHLKT
jgi:hypothetical protein